MLFKRWFQMFYYSIKLNKLIPIKINNKVYLKIRKNASLKLNGRLNLGLRRSEARVSTLPVNFYMGENSSAHFGHSVSVGQGVNIILKDHAKLMVGDSTYFTSDLHLEAENEIVIGKNCAISWGTTIIDSNHHAIVISTKEQKVKGKVLIGDHVWVGCNVTILKDTTIGDNCVIAAASVVKGNFPANSLIAGNPAEVVKSDVNWK